MEDRYENGECRPCSKASKAKWRTENPEQVESNNAKYRAENPEKLKAKDAKWYAENQEKAKATHAKWQAKNRDYSAKQRRERRKINVQFRLACNLRARLTMSIKNNQKVGSAVRDLGCSVSELKLHLENLFQPGMCWENWSRNGWHIDHIIPLSKFDLSDREQLLKACHFTNLQPLWAHGPGGNLSKVNK